MLFRSVPFTADVSYPGINQIPHTALGNPTTGEQQYENENNRKDGYYCRSSFLRHADAGSYRASHENKTCKNSERINIFIIHISTFLRLFMQRYTLKTVENKRRSRQLKFIKKSDNIYIVKILIYRGLYE